MNIVKIKDIAVSDLPSTIDADVFSKFKDMYCYCINWKWLVLFDDLNNSNYTYITLSQELSRELDGSTISTHNPLEDFDYALYEQYLEEGLIDLTITEQINSIAKYLEYNKFSYSDDELTYDDVKLFRTWLAQTLYNILEDEADQDVLEMLNYYALEMNDATITHLIMFTPKTTVDVISPTYTTSCGCQGATSIQIYSLSDCDPIAIYRKAVYDKMVDVFSDITFWTERETELLQEIKKYVDYIIAKNLPLTTSDYISDLYDCGCLSDADSSQTRLMGYLKNLSTSLGYMIDGEITSHKNFISDSLNKWAVYLYEKMRWY